MDITYVVGLRQYVAIEHDRVLDTDRNRDALIKRVGEPTASSALSDDEAYSLCLVLKNDECYVYEEGDILVGRYTKTTAFYFDQLYRTGGAQ